MTATVDADAKRVPKEHGENDGSPEMTPKLGLEQLAQELPECLSADNLPIRVPLAQRLRGLWRT